MSSFIAELYQKREYIPSEVLLSFNFDESELELTQEYLRNLSKRSVKIRIPQKGNSKKMCDLVFNNAKEQANQYKVKAEQDNKVLVKLMEILNLDTVPQRIEAYDISNLGNEHITAGMVVSENGKLKKSSYKVFKMKNQDKADDYSAMKEVISRRLDHLSDTLGDFSNKPDLILLDGGMTHVGVVKQVLLEKNIDIPVFGMVKDEHHKTRTLVTENEEISIAKEQAVFVFVYKLQEEVHRFTVSQMDKSKRKTYKKFAIESVKGIGSKKAKAIMNYFKTLSKIREANVTELMQVKGIGLSDAESIYNYFNEKEE